MAARKGARKGHRKQLAWRSDQVVLARMEQVERRHLVGWPNVRIAKDLGVAEGTVRADIKHLNELWLERISGTQEDFRGRAAAKLEEVQRRAFEAAEFDEACEMAVIFGEEVEIGGKPRRAVRNVDGEVTFKGNKVGALNLARQSTMDWAKIMGVVVEKVSQTDADGNDITLADLATRAREARAQREAAAAPTHS